MNDAMKRAMRYAVIVLPLMAVLAVGTWWLFGALMRKDAVVDDMMVWLGELPIATCWAIAVLVGAIVAMEATGMNIDNAQRRVYVSRVAEGDSGALWVLLLEAGCWFGMITASALVFGMGR